ncbi:probable apyrase 6 [Chenopodium quinoa]|uniref:probable apyrase 6 n=1 Tax=Chenopodium quinoa TaxID=63459 RepID=UPI000B791394|nr:probable apyrase 6 [Chenopodium quinoa]
MRRPNARSPKPNSEIKSDPDPKMEPLSIKSFQFKQNPNSRSSSFSRIPKAQPKFNWVTVFFISVAFVIVFYLSFVFLGQRTPVNGRKFGIIIDGGSTGSRIHVFEYKVEGGVPRFDFGPDGHSSMRVNPGLSSFEDNPERAGESLMELLDFGKRIVPRELWGDTEVRLMATAGLRLLDLEVQNRILESCRRLMRSSGLKFRGDWASVITGSDEGLYAWVVANYALGTLGGDPHLTTGIIELGGASAQVTFVSRESVPSEFSRSLNYGNVTYHLYSNSLLHFGQNVAFDTLKDLLVSSDITLATKSSEEELTMDPCTPKGYAESINSFNLAPDSSAKKYLSTFHAAGNFSECRAAALKLLQRGKEGCAYDHCTLGATFMPKLHGRFLATENFFHTSQFFGLASKAVLSDLMEAGQAFCEENWPNIRKKYSSLAEEDLLHYCFSSAYIVAFLHDSLNIALDDTSIGYTNQVENVPLDWALGAFILQTTAINGANYGWVSLISDNFPNSFLIMGATILLTFAACYVFQWRKPYFKTIYDLEKGRYIITRINR